MTLNPNTNAPTTFLDLTDSDLVRVIPIPSCEYALNGVQNTLHVLFQIKTGAKGAVVERPACDLAIVLDHSGSMQGEKLNNSKLAIKQVIQKLNTKDKLHVIQYDSTAEVVFEDGDVGRPELLDVQVDKIKPAGSTNLHAGLKLGSVTLKKYKAEGNSRVQRVFLFSDGLVNHGKTKPEDIKKLVQKIRLGGISISSFGIGADYDEELMKTISENGSGDYFFIENADAISKYVDKGLRGLLGLVGTNAVLKIRGKNGGIVKQIYAHTDIIAGAKLGDLKQNNLRQIVCVVELAPTKGEGDDIVSWTLSYIPDGETQEVTVIGNIRDHSIDIKFTDDDALLSKKNSAVEVAKTMQEIGDSDLNVLTLLDQGKKAEALELKEQDLVKLKQVQVLDTTGTIEALVARTTKAIESMKVKQDVQEIRKEVHYNGYLQRRNSAYAIFD